VVIVVVSVPAGRENPRETQRIRILINEQGNYKIKGLAPVLES
jgi:hypothetical protein